MYFMPFYKQKQPFLFVVIRSICARTCMYLGTDLLTYYLTICECKRIPIILLTLATLSELSNKNQIKYSPYLLILELRHVRSILFYYLAYLGYPFQFESSLIFEAKNIDKNFFFHFSAGATQPKKKCGSPAFQCENHR